MSGKHSIQCLLVAALREEIEPLIQMLLQNEISSVQNGVRRFDLEGYTLAIATCGVGGTRSVQTLTPLIHALLPQFAILTGWAGTLVSSHTINNLVTLTRVHPDASDASNAFDASNVSDASLTSDAFDASVEPLYPLPVIPHLETRTTRPVPVEGITVDRMVCRQSDKDRLHDQSGASVVEMETWYVARLFREHGIPLAGIRVISDSADETIGLDFDAIPSGRVRRATYFASHPIELARMISLKKQLAIASQRLAEYLSSLLQSEEFRNMLIGIDQDARR